MENFPTYYLVEDEEPKIIIQESNRASHLKSCNSYDRTVAMLTNVIGKGWKLSEERIV